MTNLQLSAESWLAGLHIRLARIIHDLEDTKALLLQTCCRDSVCKSKRGLRVSDNSTTQCLLLPIFSQAFGAAVRSAAGQFRRRSPAAKGRRPPLWIDRLSGRMSARRAAGGQGRSFLEELLAQRVFSIACGYPDANDAARLAADPIHKMLLDRDPGAGRDLASQPTLSRFENAIGVKELYRLGEALAPACSSAMRTLARSCAPRHPRSGSDRRSHSRGAAAVVLQPSLR